MSDNDLQVVNTNGATELTTLSVNDLVTRFKAGLKRPPEHKQQPTQDEYIALAMLSRAYGFNPFHGETWIIPGSGVMVGIKGLRKAARRQSQSAGVRYWGQKQMLRPDEMRTLGIPDKAVLAATYTIRRSDEIEAYSAAVAALSEALRGLPNIDAAEFIISTVGKPPLHEGVGYVIKDEKSKMPYPQLVMKRAESHALKQAFDVEFLGENVYTEDQAPDLFVVTPEDASEVLYGSDVGWGDEPQEAEIVYDDEWPFSFNADDRLDTFNKSDWKSFHAHGAEFTGLTQEAFDSAYKDVKALYEVGSGKNIADPASAVLTKIAGMGA